ncbi:MAG: hypothetical protein PHS33_08055 [Candidatus Omnitrophica bacterium]|nr:hypothetical protein [Candidatus Omnitrophota bacterium]MDD5264701.1 hypothetical protein [Candidatus Bipolaricaulis sp.]
MDINLDKLEKTDAPKEVIEVYKRVKTDLIDDPDRKTWERIRKRCWSAAYPLDPNKEDSIWTAKEREEMTNRGQIPIQVNDLARDIQGASALITSKNPGLNFLPIGSSDLYIAELFKRGWDFVINGNQGAVTFYDFIKEKNIGNLAVLEAKHDPSLGIFGKIIIQDIDPTTYYFSKDSKQRDHSDVSFGKAHLVTKDYALETYDELKEEDLQFTAIKKEESEGDVPDRKTGMDNYAVDTNEEPTTDPDEKEPEDIWEIEDWEFKKEKEIWVMIPDPKETYGYKRKIYKNYSDIEKDGWILDPDKKTAKDTMGVVALVWKRIVTKRIQRIIVGKKMISKVVNPLGIDTEGAPVLPLIALQEDRTLSGYPTGKTARALELNRAANKRRMQSIYLASKNIDALKLFPAGIKWIVDEKHGDYVEVPKDAAFAPTQMGPVNTSAELINLLQVDTQSIHDEYQINDIIQGKIPAGQNNMAHRTVLSLTEMVGVISSPGVLTFESALVRLGKAVAALMLMVWPRPMWERLIEPDELGTWTPDKEKPQVDQNGQPIPPEASVVQQKWKDAIDKLTGENGQTKTDLIDIDVKIIAGSTQPTNRMAKQGVAIEMMKAGAYDVQAVLDYTDDPKKDEITERMEKKRQEELDAIRQGQAVKGTKTT